MGVPVGVGAAGFAHAQIVEIQRSRILSGMFDVVDELGVGSVSVAHVVERSGVSRRTFYEFFKDREDCFLAAFEEALSRASERVLAAYRSQDMWRERIRTGLIALLSFLEDEPVVGRLLICESLAAGARVLERRAQVLALLTSAVDDGCKESESAASLPALSAEGLVGGALAVIHARLAARPPHPMKRPDGVEGRVGLVGLVNPLMSMIVTPYLGLVVGRRELARPLPTCVSEPKSAMFSLDLFKEAGMRLTYRTVLVLLAIAERPCASNRVVGEAAGIADQGQISKLLGRLQRLGLVSNTGLGQGQGGPNAWSLTGKGRQVANSISAHTDSVKP
jgi:AcrR family transcriptional regulator/DNA-binding MarR family transcriptional regulator